MSNRDRTLRGVELLRSLPDSDIVAIEKACRWRELDAEERLASAKEMLRDVYFVVTGRIRVSVCTRSGKEVVFADVPAGSLVGELSVIDGLGTATSFEARERSLVASLDHNILRELVERDRSVRAALLLHLTRRIRMLMEQLVEISTLSVRERIHAELRRLARNGKVVEGGVVISPMPTHAEIAARLGTHREAVSRELSDLARLRILERAGRDLKLVDPAALDAPDET